MNMGQQSSFYRVIVGERTIIAPLYVDDGQLAEFVLGAKARMWTSLVRQLEGEGLPRRKQLFGSMRYLPAVISFFDAREGVRVVAQTAMSEDGPEHFGP